MSPRHALFSGTLFALAAGLMWGLVFVAPLMLPQYPAALLTFGRYLAFGLIALPLAWLDRRRINLLTRADWLDALKLALIGNLVYYFFLSAAIQRAGGPLPTMLIGTLPVVIAIVANLRLGGSADRLPWARLAPSLLLIAAGIALVNQVEWQHVKNDPRTEFSTYLSGAALTLVAVACWTWYPLRNADWLRAHPGRSPRTWATAQGLATLPLALLGYLGFALWTGVQDARGQPVFEMPLGPTPMAYIALMLAMGLLASWLGTLCWNEASQRLPTSLAGQLIVFETLAALAYAFMLRGHWPVGMTMVGIGLLVAGVVWGLRAKPTPLAATAHPH